MRADAQLTPRQMRAIAAILATTTREEAAKLAAVSTRTIRRWAALETFASELRRQRTREIDATTSILVAGAGHCARVLIEVATAGGSPRDAVRASAARWVLELAHRLEEQATLAARLTEMEIRLATMAQSSRKGTWQ